MITIKSEGVVDATVPQLMKFLESFEETIPIVDTMCIHFSFLFDLHHLFTYLFIYLFIFYSLLFCFDQSNLWRVKQ